MKKILEAILLSLVDGNWNNFANMFHAADAWVIVCSLRRTVICGPGE